MNGYGKACVYRIDPSDIIFEIDEDHWDGFAMENAAEDLVRENVLGRSLWIFVSDPAVRHIYKLLLGRIRAGRASASFPFRCDSPSMRRFLRMNIMLCGNGLVEFRSVIVREESRPRASILDATVSRSTEIVTICSFCKKVKMAGWVEVEDAIRLRPLLDSTPAPAISHGVCEACYETVVNQLSVED